MTRVRFAPSPTGYLHIGGARTFIFNWLYARHNRGTMILRIDDTDLERNSELSLESIHQGLEWLELGWDEYYRVANEQYSACRRQELPFATAHGCGRYFIHTSSSCALP